MRDLFRLQTREASIARILDHKNVCKLKALTYKKEMCRVKSQHKIRMYLYLIMEYVSDSVHELLRCARLRNNAQLPLDLVRSITKQMFCALSYIHKVGICHRDIKPQNLVSWLSIDRLSRSSLAPGHPSQTQRMPPEAFRSHNRDS